MVHTTAGFSALAAVHALGNREVPTGRYLTNTPLTQPQPLDRKSLVLRLWTTSPTTFPSLRWVQHSSGLGGLASTVDPPSLHQAPKTKKKHTHIRDLLDPNPGFKKRE